MAGDVTLPAVGPVSKKALLIGGGAAALVMVVLWLRKRNTPAPSTVDTSSTDTSGLDTYGVDEGAYAGTGGVGPVQAGAPITSNPQWTATVMQDLSGVADPTALAAALGLYLTGSAVSPEQTALIDQAIAVAGWPPVAGANGYPPAIRTQPAGGQTPPADAVYRDTREGQSVQSFLNYYGISYAQMLTLNPGIQNSITRANSHGYLGPSNPANGTEVDVFGSVVHVRLK